MAKHMICSAESKLLAPLTWPASKGQEAVKTGTGVPWEQTAKGSYKGAAILQISDISDRQTIIQRFSQFNSKPKFSRNSLLAAIKELLLNFRLELKKLRDEDRQTDRQTDRQEANVCSLWIGSSLCFAGLVGRGVGDQAGVHLNLVEERLEKTRKTDPALRQRQWDAHTHSHCTLQQHASNALRMRLLHNNQRWDISLQRSLEGIHNTRTSIPKVPWFPSPRLKNKIAR